VRVLIIGNTNAVVPHRNAGRLALETGADGLAEWLRAADWSKSRAYSVGPTGLFLTIWGREAKRIVKRGDEAAPLRRSL
jgi:hypothetical protein